MTSLRSLQVLLFCSTIACSQEFEFRVIGPTGLEKSSAHGLARTMVAEENAAQTGEPVDLYPHIRQQSYGPDPANPTCVPGGLFRVKAVWTNASDQSFANLFATVMQLTGNNQLVDYSFTTFTQSGQPSPTGILGPYPYGLLFATFTIRLASCNRFQFFVKLYASDSPRVRRIQAVTGTTPCRRPAPPVYGDSQTFSSIETTRNFNRPTTLVLLRNSTGQVTMTAETTGAGNVRFFVQRGNDAPQAGGAGDLPTLSDAGIFWALGTNQTGSFSVGAFVDANNNNLRDATERPTYLNLILVSVTAVNDLVQPYGTWRIAPGHFPVTVPAVWDHVQVTTGTFEVSRPETSGISLLATVDLLGGGPDGQLGLDRAFGGWVNNELQEITWAFYPSTQPVKQVFVDTTQTPIPHYRYQGIIGGVEQGWVKDGATAMFGPPDPEPALLPGPYLDCGRVPAGAGGEMETLNTSSVSLRQNLALGQRLRISAVDSPSDFFMRHHPFFLTANLNRIAFNITFTAYLALWTNSLGTDGRRGSATLAHVNGSADGLFMVAMTVPWYLNNADWSVDGNGQPTRLFDAPEVDTAGRTIHFPPTRAGLTGIELCPPTFATSLARNARQ